MKNSDFMKERNELHKNFEAMMPETAKSFNSLMDFTFTDGALSAKMKELIALAISVTVRCEPCMNYHLEEASAKGASKEEILEAMNVGYEMAVGQVVPPLRRVLRYQFVKNANT